MQYDSFTIENYRGVSSTRIEMPKGKGSRVTTLIGLNESGKTTILEAIYSFSPDPESKALYGETVILSEDPSYYIPRREFSNFNGDISVVAEVSFEEGEIEKVLEVLKKASGLAIDPGSIPQKFSIVSKRSYKSSRQENKITRWLIEPKVRTGQQKVFRNPNQLERQKIISVLLSRLPKIAYFPTFVFEFPERIYLKGGPDKAVDKFYKNIFQAILDAGDEGHTIKEHIVARYESIHDQGFLNKLADAAAQMIGIRSAIEMIKQTVDRAGDTVSELIVSKWDEIFKHSPLKKEITIEPFERYEEFVSDDGSEFSEHDVWVEFKVKDAGTRYNISDRSLGFRWFFCFLLFTKFMTGRSDKRILFLFDEPASNLHAKAQEKLLENFSAIAEFPNSLIFSTHSHYMIEPTWLDRAYVVKNDAIDYDDPSGEKTRAKGIRIEAIKYRAFMSESGVAGGSSTYFQPVLDRLEIRPSQLDLQAECIVVEGKSDFHILTYIKRNYLKSAPAIVPALGATTMRPVIGLLRGWATRFVILLDSDKEGRESANTYKNELDLGDEIRLIGEFCEGCKEIEDAFSSEDKEKIRLARQLSSLPNKKTLSRLFQEANASGTKLPLSRGTIEKLKGILSGLTKDLNGLPKLR